MKKILFFALLVLLFAVSCSPFSNVIWRIGLPDDSSNEFSSSKIADKDISFLAEITWKEKDDWQNFPSIIGSTREAGVKEMNLEFEVPSGRYKFIVAAGGERPAEGMVLLDGVSLGAFEMTKKGFMSFDFNFDIPIEGKHVLTLRCVGDGGYSIDFMELRKR
jgi:hypothetical protein